jgi:hypothetical protein
MKLWFIGGRGNSYWQSLSWPTLCIKTCSLQSRGIAGYRFVTWAAGRISEVISTLQVCLPHYYRAGSTCGCISRKGSWAYLPTCNRNTCLLWRWRHQVHSTYQTIIFCRACDSMGVWVGLVSVSQLRSGLSKLLISHPNSRIERKQSERQINSQLDRQLDI